MARMTTPDTRSKRAPSTRGKSMPRSAAAAKSRKAAVKHGPRGRKAEAPRHARRRAAEAKDGKLLTALVVILLIAGGLLIFSYTHYRVRGAAERSLTNVDPVAEGKVEDLPDGIIAEGIRYKEFKLENLSYEEAAKLLSDNEKTILDRLPSTEIKYGSDSQTLTPYEMGIRLDIEQLVKDAETQSKKFMGRQPILKDRYRLDGKAFSDMMSKLADDVNQEGQDAKATGFDAEKREFIFDKEKEGRVLDLDASRSALRDKLKSFDFGGTVELKVKVSPPGRTAEELQKMLGHVSNAATPILSSNPGRNTNVKLAADRISGTIIQPGESFSYNKTIGPMTTENGFVAAGVQDEFGNDALGIGGGLCQPSTTLYQAAVRANLKIDVHNFHSTPVLYCPIGTDAMVSNWSDLVFSNPTEYPYAITAYFDGATLAFDIYGPPNPDNAVIDLSVEELGATPVEGEPKKIEDPELPAGETSVKVKPRPNRHVRVYKTYTVNGQLVKSELLYDHTYPGSTGVVAYAKGMDEFDPKGSETMKVGEITYIHLEDGRWVNINDLKKESQTP